MDKPALKKIYADRETRFDALLKKQNKNLLIISLLRLAVIILAVWFLVLGVKHEYPLMYVISGLMVILFFVLVSYHKNLNDRKKMYVELAKINEEELLALDHQFSSFDDGQRFNDPGHPWSFDLDLFGEGSLYQSANRTATHTGPAELADLLSLPVTDPEEIKSRQELTQELARRIDLRQHFTAHARLMKKEDTEFKDVMQWMNQDVFIVKYRWTKVVAIIMSLLSMGFIFAGIFNPGLYIFLIYIALVNFALLSPFVNRTGKYHSLVSRKHNFLSTYADLLDILSAEEYTHSELKQLAEKCRQASGSIGRLSRLLNLFDQRLNFIVGVTLNALFLFDFHMLHRLAAWNGKNKTEITGWLTTAGKFDAWFSLAGVAYNHPGYTYPEIRSGHPGLIAKNLGHPMIPGKKRVDNTIEIRDEKVVLITGANMAGKSTFLRSVGVNMVLAYAGCPVCAEQFIAGNYRLFSSMRTADSLKDDESYFFAEIKRLKQIVEEMEDGEKLLILLDEVLKGTNTTDKQKGSRGLIEKSVRHDVLCFIATHDLALGEMEKEHKGKVINYCFESYIKDLELTFDYSIRRGLAKNMNASFLMKQMGIMD